MVKTKTLKYIGSSQHFIIKWSFRERFRLFIWNWKVQLKMRLHGYKTFQMKDIGVMGYPTFTHCLCAQEAKTESMTPEEIEKQIVETDWLHEKNPKI